jgi:hypothetical protein
MLLLTDWACLVYFERIGKQEMYDPIICVDAYTERRSEVCSKSVAVFETRLSSSPLTGAMASSYPAIRD